MGLNLRLPLQHDWLILEENGLGKIADEDGWWPPIVPSCARVTFGCNWNVVHKYGLRSLGRRIVAVHLVAFSYYVHAAFAAVVTAVTRLDHPRVNRA